MIELFNIKKFFDGDIKLRNWSDSEYNKYKNITKKFDRVIAIFFSEITDENFIEKVNEVAFEYITGLRSNAYDDEEEFEI